MKTFKEYLDDPELQRRLYYENEMKKKAEFQANLIGGFSILFIISLGIIAVILFK